MIRRISGMMIVLGSLAFCSQALAHSAGRNAPSPDLPPIIPDNEYLSPADVHARYSGPALEVVLSKIEHQPFAGTSFPDPQGERHHFESQVRGQVSINGGPPQPFMANGPVDTIAYGRPPGGLGTFDTEMLSMTLTGGGGVMIRESPTLPSLGKSSITDIGGGLYHIDSFFDVFTELSLDGGASWIPNSEPNPYGPGGSTRVVLGIPEPASVALLALGLLGACGLVRRR
ncbi:MAG: PEP-CTERM sorting domain-containing protein [Planctomycetes bacterium]|nr:PEP-CTERM sorting domain-containing protein [Planctomycetota bacterium]